MSFIISMFLNTAIASSPFITTKAGGDWVGNAGMAESNFNYAASNIENYLDICLTNNVCGLSSRQSQVATKILNSMVFEKRNLNFIEFIENDNFFWDEETQNIGIARTRYAVGETIYINKKLLYEKVGKKIRVISLAQAYAVLLHELGHHQGITDHAWLDKFGSHMSQFLNSAVDLRWAGSKKQLVAMTVNIDKKYGLGKSTQIIMSDGFENYELSKKVIKVLKCPKTWGGKSPAWFKVDQAPDWRNVFKGQIPFVSSRVKLFCKRSPGKYEEFNQAKIEIHPQFSYFQHADGSNVLKFKKNGFNLKYTNCLRQICN